MHDEAQLDRARLEISLGYRRVSFRPIPPTKQAKRSLLGSSCSRGASQGKFYATAEDHDVEDDELSQA